LRVPASPGGVAEPAVLSVPAIPAIPGNPNRKSNALGDPENCG
jgi:hypothetical protein